MGAGTETAKPSNLNPSPGYEGFGHLLKQRFDGIIHRGKRQIRFFLGEAFNEVGSVHVGGQCVPQGWVVGHDPVNHSNPQQVATQAEHGRSRPQFRTWNKKRVRIPFALKSLPGDYIHYDSMG